MTVDCDVVLDGDARATGLKQRWTFDAMYSAYALTGLDRDGDRRYSADELAPLVRTMTASIRDDAYFTRVSLDGVSAPVGPAEGHALEVDPSGELVLSFGQKLADAAPLRGRSLRIEVRDVEYFVDFQFSKARPPALTPPTAGCAAKVDDGQPPAGANPEDVMNALIRGPVQTLASAIVAGCK